MALAAKKPIWRPPSRFFFLAVIGFGDWRLHSEQKNVSWVSVGLLLVPAWDFDADSWWLARMATLRGIENGFSTAPAPQYQILNVSDTRGMFLSNGARR